MNEFFQKRLAKHHKKMMKYLRYVFNDHFVLVCLFLIGGLGLYYSSWLKTLPSTFHLGGIMITLFWFVCLMMGKIATFAEPADLVFLLPKEKEMHGYLQQAFRYSCLFPMIGLGLAGGFAMPLVVVTTQQPFSMFFIYLGILWSLKFSHLQLKRAGFFRLDQKVMNFWKSAWWVSTLIILLLTFYTTVWLGFLLALIQSGLYYWFLWKKLTAHLDWEKMIQSEKQRLHQIYQFINLFTDVPEITAKVKRRRYLDPALHWIKNETNNTYLYLYARRFARGSDFIGLYMRLTVIGSIIIAGINELYFTLALGSLFLYLIGFQLLPLYSQFRYMILVQLYPIPEEQKKVGIQRLLSWILTFVAVLFGIVAAIVLSGTERWLPLLVYLLVDGLLIKWYVPNRLKKMD
ncbi:hypothetical protein A5844_002470 [Enterococcus sp. 10A9_DIV0425]|uniref:ABC transporter EcsB n=1 Tax=Candidatus Enterococcus wittei TaxID=1987383 RepID=A0A242JVS7_9ENTE|nr:ABC transporter permease [Enterococcus sp. 10A9_DIV0425]OTP06798.1 hypothetical protein A5844_002470 [Enterococcus sp. 10A9_DIV0425]THE12915.1 ABC transporter permease [Enterococcus hirae]